MECNTRSVVSLHYHQAVVVPPSPHAAAPLAPVPSVAVPQDELDMELKRVHALEHACNGYCNLANEEHLVSVHESLAEHKLLAVVLEEQREMYMYLMHEYVMCPPHCVHVHTP